MKPFTYLLGWTIHDKWYYGVRYALNCDPSDLGSKYLSSSKYVKQFIEQYGLPDIMKIRKIFKTTKAAREWEEKVLKRMKVKSSDRWLNKNDRSAPPPLIGHTFNRGRTHNEETKEKKRSSMKNTMAKKYPLEKRKIAMKFGSNEYIEYMRKSSQKMWDEMSDEKKKTRSEKISVTNKGLKNRLGHKNSAEHNEAIKQYNRNKVVTEETRAKMSEAKKGKKMSEERRLRQSQIIKESWERRKANVT